MAKEKIKRKGKKVDKVWLGIRIAFWAVVLAYYVFLIFGGSILGETSMFYLSLNIFSKIANPNIPIRLLSYVLFVLSLSFAAQYLLRFLGRFMHKGRAVMNLIASLIKYVAVIVLIFLILSAFQVDPMTLLVSAGVVSLVIGLGAQSLVSDVIAGLFIVFEGTFEIGDIVVIDGFRGTVKEIGVRTTQIVDWGGNIKVINNSDIRSMVNMTSELSVALVECDVEYGESLPRVETVIRDNLEKMKAAIPEIIDGPFYLGVSALGASGVTLKFTAQCEEGNRFQVERDMMRQLKLIFDENDVGIPFPQVTINQPKAFVSGTKHQKKAADKFLDEQSEKAKDIPTDGNQIK